MTYFRSDGPSSHKLSRWRKEDESRRYWSEEKKKTKVEQILLFLNKSAESVLS